MNKQLPVRSSDFIQQQDRFWMPAITLGEKIGYQYPRQSMSKIYNRNADELEPFTSEVKMATEKGERFVRAFDEQGCYIVAMLAKTAQAKAFRQGLAQFLQQLRDSRTEAMQMRFKVAELHDEYEKTRQEIEKMRLQQKINRTDWTWNKLKRIHRLKQVLTFPEIGRVFGYSGAYLKKLERQYRYATGGNVPNRPKNLQEVS